MKIPIIIITDQDSGKHTAFFKHFPGICAQADSIEEAKAKLDTYYRAYLATLSS